MTVDADQFVTNSKASTTATPHYYPWLVWGLAAAFFFVEYFARVAPGIMVPELMRDFGVNAVALGGLAASFYYAYIVMQLPVGVMMDRFGPRVLLSIMAALCALSSYIFATADGVWMAQVGRFILGFASAFAFVGALKLASIWFPPSRIGLLAGLTQALGMLGAAVGEAPMSYLVQHVGWRETVLIVGAIFALLSLTMLLVIRDREATHAIDTSESHLLAGLKHVLKNKFSWYNALLAGLLFSPTAALGELWGVSYIKATHGLSEHSAAFAVGCMFIGWAIAGPFVGALSDKLGRRKPVMIASAMLCLLFLCLVLFVPGLPAWLVYLLFLAFGMSNTGVGIAYAAATEINPRAISGASLAFANMMSIAIGACFQPLMGLIMDLHADGITLDGVPVYSASDYQAAVLLLPVALLLAILVATRVKETYCKGAHSL